MATLIAVGNYGAIEFSDKQINFRTASSVPSELCHLVESSLGVGRGGVGLKGPRAS